MSHGKLTAADRRNSGRNRRPLTKPKRKRLGPKLPPPFSRFGKGIAESVALSFGRSANDNCDPCCRVWDSCYASRIERIYTHLAPKLGKHFRMGATRLVNRAIVALRSVRMPVKWFRFSVDGSLPSRRRFTARQWRAFGFALRQLVVTLQQRGAKIHLPVESFNKARSYRALLGDLGVVVRRTSQARTVRELLQSDDHRAWIVNTVPNGFTRGRIQPEDEERNIAAAYDAAREARDAGQSAVVCPAIASDNLCGKCTACAEPMVDIVLYPFHH